MAEVEKVLKSYLSKIKDRLGSLASDIAEPILTGVPSMDKYLKLYPGFTLIYSQPDGGRTSLAKRLAISAHRQGLNVLYYDTEHKMMLHDPSVFDGIVLATGSKSSGMKELIGNGLIDFMVIDTITGAYGLTKEKLQQIKTKVPFIVVLTQMKHIPTLAKESPATTDGILSSAHTWIYLTSKEKLLIEGVGVARIQYQYTKCEMKRELTGTRDSFIVRNNLVDGVYSAYDYLRSSGSIRSVGKCKSYSSIDGSEEVIGTIKEAVLDPQMSLRIISFWLKETGLDFTPEVYIG